MTTGLIGEFRQALRSLIRTPLFTGVAVLTVALGVGANAAVFGVVREVLLRPLPFVEADRLVLVEPFPLTNPDAPWEFSYPNFLDTRRAATGFTAMAAYPTTPPRHVLEMGDVAQTVEVSWVSGEFFAMLGVDAARGRAILPEDDVANAPRVAVLSDAAWRERFGAAPDAVGRTIRLNGYSYNVVGVMPPRVEFPNDVEIWTALRPELEGIAEDRSIGFLTVAGRLAPGVTPEQATAEVGGIAARLAEEYTPGYTIGASVRSLADSLFGPARPVLLLLSAAAGLVLLIACANVASLMLARGAASRREVAVRAALGAGSGRLALQPAIQATILALTGGVVGVGLAWLSLDFISARLPDELYRSGDVEIDRAVVGFSGAAALLAAFLFGVAPTLRAARGRVPLGPASRATFGAPARRLSRAIMAGQLALATAVLIAGALIARSFIALNRVDPGFAEEGTLTLSVFLPPELAAGQDAVFAFYDEMIERVRSLPGVTDAAAVLLRPLEGPDGYDYPFTIEGRAAEEQASYPYLNYEAITPAWFSTMGIPLLSGRTFEAADDAEAPGVVIISSEVAERFFADRDPVGQRLKWGGPNGESPWLTIVGVAGSARYRDLREPSLDVYVPYRQSPWPLNHLAIRATVPPITLVSAVQRVIGETRPGARGVQIATVRDLLDRSLSRPRFQTMLLGTFALLAITLVAAGVFGVTGYLTAWRTREVGVRMAVGATPHHIRTLILGDTARVVAIGIALGIALAWAGAGLFANLLYGVPARDAGTIFGVAAGLGAIALAASWLPARRAMRVEPVAALRSE